MKHILWIGLLLIRLHSSGQTLYDKVWVQGGGVSFTSTFNGTNVTNAFLDTIYSPYFTLGHSNICNKFGDLILSTDGYNIYDQQNNVLDNGDSVVPTQIILRETFSSYSQSSIFLPFPNNQYYLITPTASDTCILNHWGAGSSTAYFDLMLYAKIDMNANGGQGSVVKKKQIFLDGVPISKTGMMACRHGNGKDWWLFKQGIYGNKVFKFLITADSIYNYGMQNFPAPLFNEFDQNGQLMFSQDGTKYASTIRGNKSVFVADFDRCTGILSNPKVYPVSLTSCHNIYDTTCYENLTEGLCFSPNGRFVYVCTYYNVKQLDLLDNDSNTQWSWIHGLDTVWDYCNSYSNMYLGPNNKLYLGHWSGLGDAMSVIENPDVKGMGCNFCELCCRFPKYGSTNPPCMPNYHLGAAPVGGTCWPVTTNDIQGIDDRIINVFPNPSHNSLTIQLNSHATIFKQAILLNTLGQEIMSFTISGNHDTTVDISRLQVGIYYLKVGSTVKKILVQ